MLAVAALTIPSSAYYGMDYHSSVHMPHYPVMHHKELYSVHGPHMVPVMHPMPYDMKYKIKTHYNYPLHY